MPSIYDVARKAEVGSSAVSRYLNQSGYVSAAARERIAAAIEELGFTPNRIARSLRTKRTGLIGFVTFDLDNPVTAELARGIIDSSRLHNYTTLVYTTDGNGAHDAETFTTLRDHQIEGLIVNAPGTAEGDACLVELQKAGLPIVMIGRTLEPNVADHIITDSYSASVEAVVYLANLGHERIACVTSSAPYQAVRERLRGYQDGLKKVGLPIDEQLIVRGGLDFESGRSAMATLLHNERPSAILTVNDLVALGVMHHAISCGFVIPDDLSVIGFDNIALAEWFMPTLTTIEQPKFSAGQAAYTLLRSRIEADDALPPQEVFLACHLIQRQSTSMVKRRPARQKDTGS
jgi:LacI family transcriptional regulator